jgi:hypothetical protein
MLLDRTVGYRDERDRNYRAIVTGVHPVEGFDQPALDLLYADEKGKARTLTQVPHVSHLLEPADVDDRAFKRAERNEPPEIKRRPGAHWR